MGLLIFGNGVKTFLKCSSTSLKVCRLIFVGVYSLKSRMSGWVNWLDENSWPSGQSSIWLSYRLSFICWNASLIAQMEVLFPTLLEKLFWWFQWSRGSKLWPNNTVNTKFCIKTFLGVIKTYLPKIHCKRDENYANANAETVGQNQFF